MAWRKTAARPKPGEPATLTWNPDAPATSLEALRTYVEAQIAVEVHYYVTSSGRVRWRSRWLRLGAIALTTLGGLVPILQSMKLLDRLFGVDSSPGSVQLGELGYVLIALAGGLVLMDRFFGYSTAWMRYITTWMAIEKIREGFRLEWLSLYARLHPGTAHDTAVAKQMIESARRVMNRVKDLTEQETQAWVMEFQSSISQMEKDLKTRIEASRPGAIDVSVTDADKHGFELWLDQMMVERITGTSGSVGHVSPGVHKVTARSNVGGKDFAASQMVVVPPGEITKIELKLGVP